MSISSDFKWFFIFFSYFVMSAHVVACFWIIAGQMSESTDPVPWTTAYEAKSKQDLYLTSFYFTITTITTVGYGDYSASTWTERIICIFIMLAGVIGFAMASGAVTNYIDQAEEQTAELEARMVVLTRLFERHEFPHELYISIKKHIEKNHA